MTDPQITRARALLAVTEDFAAPKPVWPSLIVMCGLTFCENFAKPFLRRLPGRPYPFLPGSFFGVPLQVEFRGWVAEVLPDDLMQVFDNDQPERTLQSWLPKKVFEQINHNVGLGFTRLARRRRILAAVYGPVFLLSLALILFFDLRCLFSIKDAILADDYWMAGFVGFRYLWLMLMVSICLGFRRRVVPSYE